MMLVSIFYGLDSPQMAKKPSNNFLIILPQGTEMLLPSTNSFDLNSSHKKI